MTIADLVAQHDAIVKPLATALRTNGPVYMDAEEGYVWMLAADNGPIGIRFVSLPKASSIVVPDPASVPIEPTPKP